MIAGRVEDHAQTRACAEKISIILPILSGMDAWLTHLINWLSLPEVGLSTLFVISFLAATWLPAGSEAALVGVVSLTPDLFWTALTIATVGNTLGGMVSWALGAGLHRLASDGHPASPPKGRGVAWGLRQLHRIGPKACLLAWAPIVGDVVCTLAGWLRMPAATCAFYMAVGKFLRYWLLLAGVELWLSY